MVDWKTWTTPFADSGGAALPRSQTRACGRRLGSNCGGEEGDLRSAVSAGSETRAEQGATRPAPNERVSAERRIRAGHATGLFADLAPTIGDTTRQYFGLRINDRRGVMPGGRFVEVGHYLPKAESMKHVMTIQHQASAGVTHRGRLIRSG